MDFRDLGGGTIAWEAVHPGARNVLLATGTGLFLAAAWYFSEPMGVLILLETTFGLLIGLSWTGILPPSDPGDVILVLAWVVVLSAALVVTFRILNAQRHKTQGELNNLLSLRNKMEDGPASGR